MISGGHLASVVLLLAGLARHDWPDGSLVEACCCVCVCVGCGHLARVVMLVEFAWHDLARCDTHGD